MRWIVAFLLVANLGVYAWNHGWLDGAAGGPHAQREPERLQRQVHPEVVHLLAPQAAAVAMAAASDASAGAAAGSCLEAGPFADAELALAEEALRSTGLPPGRWQAPILERAGIWLVYMGRFADRDTLARKASELDRIRVGHEPVTQPPELAPGLSLGRFDDRAAADAALAHLVQRGVHTARVVQAQPPVTLHLLRVDPAEPALAGPLQALKLPAGAGFRPCAGAGA